LGSPNVVDLIGAGKVDLIINTPGARQGRRDGYEIRRAAVDFSVPYITTIQAAVAAGVAITVAARAVGGVGVAAVREYYQVVGEINPKKVFLVHIEKPELYKRFLSHLNMKIISPAEGREYNV
jgi:carbamoyl-phosphate synthase large subunit